MSAAAERKMAFLEHLDELRRRIIVSLAAVIACSCLAFWKVKAIVSHLIIPPVDRLVFFSPAEAFIAYCKVAVAAGLIVASPVVLFQFWRFVSAGLEKSERRAAMACLPFSLVLFLGGASFGFFIVVPWALRFLIEFAGPDLTPMLSVSKYLSFVAMLVLIFGGAFELPVGIVLLTKLGIVTPRSLARNRKYAVLAVFVAAAVLTPTPDAFTQVLMAVPLYLLYEVSVLVSGLVVSRKKEGA